MAQWTRWLPRPPPLRLTAIRTVQVTAAVYLFATTTFEFRKCSGLSMIPTIHHQGDWVLVTPLTYWSPWRRPVRRGDIIFAVNPNHPGDTVCKRVIGVAGDVIEVEPRTGAAEGMLHIGRGGGRGWVKIPKGHVWLAGDNMSNSTDSRSYGPVPLALIQGQVLARVWPGFKWFTDPTRVVE